MYTTEFQKCGSPHARILFFLAKDAKFSSGDNIDRIIPIEIPDEVSKWNYYATIKDLMIHGLCGSLRSNSPCMANSRCTKHFPKKFVDSMNVDENGYPIYR